MLVDMKTSVYTLKIHHTGAGWAYVEVATPEKDLVTFGPVYTSGGPDLMTALQKAVYLIREEEEQHG